MQSFLSHRSSVPGSAFAMPDQPVRKRSGSASIPVSSAFSIPATLAAKAKRTVSRAEGAGRSGNANAGVASGPVDVFDPPTKVMSMSRCLEELIGDGAPKAQEIHQQWLARPGYEQVHAFVTSIEHRVLYGLRVEEVERACMTSEHSLGDIRKRELTAHHLYPEIRDFDTPFAFIHLYHGMLEDLGRVPLWQEVLPYLIDEVPGRFVGPLREKLRYDTRDRSEQRIIDLGMQWRLGIAYYSFLRELDLFVRLRRTHGVDVRYHLFADAALRTDLWCGETLLSLFISNSTFRSEFGGRKKTVEDIFCDAAKPLRFLEKNLQPRCQRGVVWLVEPEEIAELAQQIKSSEAGQGKSGSMAIEG